MQPLSLHGRRVHVALVGGIVEDPELRLWGQLQTDVTHQDADNGKGTCGAHPASESEVWTTALDKQKGAQQSFPALGGMGPPTSNVPLQQQNSCSHVTVTCTFKRLSPRLLV